jgi:hypothetical protein
LHTPDARGSERGGNDSGETRERTAEQSTKRVKLMLASLGVRRRRRRRPSRRERREE